MLPETRTMRRVGMSTAKDVSIRFNGSFYRTGLRI